VVKQLAFDSSIVPPFPYGRAEWPGQFALGIRFWFYESNAQGAPYPTFATNTLLGMEPQMMMWGAWYEQATGFLMWDTTAWDTSDPWGPNVSYGKTGDGVLIYPGHHDGLDTPLGSPPDVPIDGQWYWHSGPALLADIRHNIATAIASAPPSLYLPLVTR
jgi:hypothetical protein